MLHNCYIIETANGEGVIAVGLRRVQWMKLCPSLEEAAQLATELEILDPQLDPMARFEKVGNARGYWCAVPEDYDTGLLLAAGFAYVKAPSQ
jgi:hypothetical protein